MTDKTNSNEDLETRILTHKEPSRYDGWASWYTHKEIRQFIHKKITRERANAIHKRPYSRPKYDRNEGINDCVTVLKSDIPSEQINQYNPTFSWDDIRKLCLGQEKDPRLPFRTNHPITYNAVPPDIANTYDRGAFDTDDMLQFYALGCLPDTANEYIHRPQRYAFSQPEFNVEEPERVKEYNSCFDLWDILFLMYAGISAYSAEQYLESLIGISFDMNDEVQYNFVSGRRIAAYSILGLSSEKMTSLRADMSVLFPSLLRSIIFLIGEELNSDVFFDESGQKKSAIEYLYSRIEEQNQLIWTGKTSIVYRQRDVVLKFSPHYKEEIELLKKTRNAAHIMHLAWNHEYHVTAEDDEDEKEILVDPPYFAIEYIEGDSLQTILSKQTRLPIKKVIQYGNDLMSGLIELRRAGIFYHRDLRPANIMIDETQDRAVIIDLGNATTDRHAPPKDNRRYGGPNDLVSLGQIMYKMATGEHLFASDPSMERTTFADGLKHERDLAYEDTNGTTLQSYLAKVDINVHDERIRELIKECLTAKNHHYGKMRRMFEAISP
jgi:hypothetical protein